MFNLKFQSRWSRSSPWYFMMLKAVLLQLESLESCSMGYPHVYASGCTSFFSLRNTERMKALFLFLSSSTSGVLFSLNESLFCRKYLIDSSRKEERGKGRTRGRSHLTVHISCFQTWLSNPGVLQRQGGPGPPQSYWIRNFRGRARQYI